MSSSSASNTTPAVPKNTAGVIIRFAAFLYDALLIIALWFLLGVFGVAFNQGEAVATYSPFLSSACFIVAFSFNAYFWRNGGQTLGMRAWRLRLINSRLEPLTLTQCFVRFITAIASLAIFGLGYFWLWIDKDRLSWHDRMSDTRVIREPKKKK